MGYSKITDEETGQTYFQCDDCKFVSERKGDLLRHLNPKDTSDVPKCQAVDLQAIAEEKEILRAKGELPPAKKPGPKTKDTPKGPVEPLYKVDAGSSPNEILERILTKHPGINAPQRSEILDWAELKGSLTHFELHYLLEQMQGIAKNTASLVSQKYLAFLQKEANAGNVELQNFLMIGGVPNQSSIFSTSMGRPGEIQLPGLNRPGFDVSQWDQSRRLSHDRPSISASEVDNMIERRYRRDREDSKMDGLSRELQNIKEMFARQQTPVVEDNYEIIEEPIDSFGNVVPIKDAVTVRRRKVKRSDNQKPGITPEEVRGLIAEQSEIQSLRSELRDIRELFLKQSQTPPQLPISPNMEIIEEPIDQMGRVVPVSQAITIRKRMVPIVKDPEESGLIKTIELLGTLGLIGNTKKEDPSMEVLKQQVSNLAQTISESRVDPQFDIIEEPVDAEGNVTSPANAITIRRRKVLKQSTADDNLMKTITTFKTLGIIKPDKADLTLEDVRRLIVESQQTKGVTLEDVQKLMESKSKDDKIDQLTGAVLQMQHKIEEQSSVGQLSKEERMIQEQRRLLETAGQSTEKIFAKTLDMIQPALMKGMSQPATTPIQQQFVPHSYSDEEISNYANALEQTPLARRRANQVHKKKVGSKPVKPAPVKGHEPYMSETEQTNDGREVGF